MGRFLEQATKGMKCCRNPTSVALGVGSGTCSHREPFPISVPPASPQREPSLHFHQEEERAPPSQLWFVKSQGLYWLWVLCLLQTVGSLWALSTSIMLGIPTRSGEKIVLSTENPVRLLWDPEIGKMWGGREGENALQVCGIDGATQD